MNMFFILSAILAGIATLGALGLGLFSMIKGGEFNKKYGNKLMQLRVMLQGVALAMLALAYYSSQN
ncbi:MAG: twin transmembrane helix small protein [Alphaproteobacteria bacterium]|nr:twin transmembrane helix small protein [Alphaproteobacteria bacterium]